MFIKKCLVLFNFTFPSNKRGYRDDRDCGWHHLVVEDRKGNRQFFSNKETRLPFPCDVLKQHNLAENRSDGSTDISFATISAWANSNFDANRSIYSLIHTKQKQHRARNFQPSLSESVWYGKRALPSHESRYHV